MKFETTKERQELYDILKTSNNPKAKPIADRLYRELEYEKACRAKEEKKRKEAKEDSSLKVSDKVVNKVISNLKKETKEKDKRLKDLIKKGADYYLPAINYLKTKGAVDDEYILYCKEKFPEDVLPVITDLMNLAVNFIQRVVLLDPKYDDVEFYNDPVDNWFFNGKNDEDVNPDYFFPCEEFLLQIGDTTISYFEIAGQGISLNLAYVEDFNKFAASYGLTIDEIKKKIIKVI